mmetsp:Transcript_11424/g.18998  ORF Transcript_11424/g.18998 Transcript_11424/m.18998 type:complete len:96 (+) Transcript_11424:383-670(+)
MRGGRLLFIDLFWMEWRDLESWREKDANGRRIAEPITMGKVSANATWRILLGHGPNQYLLIDERERDLTFGLPTRIGQSLSRRKTKAILHKLKNL